MVDQMSRCIEFRLNWVRKNQNRLLMRGEDGNANDSIDEGVDHFHGGANADATGDNFHDDNYENANEAASMDDYPGEEGGYSSSSSKNKKVVLPGSIHGSRRHLSSLSRNALTIVSEHGKPTFFITLTCNADWPEIKSKLLKGNSAFDAHTVVCMVFHQRLKAFLHNLRHGKYFGTNNKLCYIMHVIEYQHRGLPHAHVSVKFHGVPEEPSDDDIATKSPDEIAAMRKAVIDFINENISCEMRSPDVHGEPLSEDDIACNELIDEFMIHKCSTAEANGCKKSPAHPCKRGFDAYTKAKPTTHIDGKGMPRYRRRNYDTDRNVVAHNCSILKDMKCHVNVEYAGTSTQVIYLYKYLFKGVSKVKAHIKIVNEKDVDCQDETIQYLKTRCLCAMDATWRMLGFHTYPVPFPSVRVIKVKLQSHLDQISEKRQTCDLQLYLKRPPALNQFKYTELFSYFIVATSKSLSTSNAILPIADDNISPYRVVHISSSASSAAVLDEGEEGAFEDMEASLRHDRLMKGSISLKPNLKYKISKESLGGVKEDWYMIARKNPEASICRLEMVPLTAGEIWYLRLILLHEHPRGLLNDALFYRNTEMDADVNHAAEVEATTFQEKAIAKGYVKDSDVAMTAFTQCIESNFHTPSALRGLFALMTLNGFPTINILENEDFHKAMLQDILDRLPPSMNNRAARAGQALLRDLQKRICRDGGSMEAYGLPTPADTETELQEEQLKYDRDAQQAEFARLDGLFPNNVEQDAVAERITEAVLHPNPTGHNFFFIDGKGGCGKTTLCKKLQAKFRALGKIVKVCASIGVACLLYEDALTAHSLFKFPVQDEGDDHEDGFLPSCNLHEQRNAERFELLMNTDVVFWDEFPSNHLHLFEAVQRALYQNKKLVFVCIGDFAQILPVVKFGTPEEVMAVLITSSKYWEKFTILRLRTNMRLAGLHSMQHQGGTTSTMTESDILNYNSQRDYKACIDAVALGSADTVHSEVTFITNKAGIQKPSIISWAAVCESGPIERKIMTVLPMMQYFAEDSSDILSSQLSGVDDTTNLYTEEDLNVFALHAMMNDLSTSSSTPTAAAVPPFPNPPPAPIAIDPTVKTPAVEKALSEFLYPGGFTFERAQKVCILATTNKRVEQWNKWVQDLNEQPVYICKSHDFFSDVDDPHGHLKKCINKQTMNKFDNIGESPPHVLELKKNDIVISMRSMMCHGIATNTRMRIVDIVTSTYTDRTGVVRRQPIVLKVETIGDEPHVALLPRIRFKVKAGTHSFSITRTQFPVRLAYAVTYNKSQSQTLDTVLVDTTQQPFAHGHLYVALSRVKVGTNIRLFLSIDQLHPGDPDSPEEPMPPGPMITNVVYPIVLINDL